MKVLEQATNLEIHAEIRRLRALQTWHETNDFPISAGMVGEKIDHLLDLLLVSRG